MTELLLIRTGEPIPPVRAEHGDFPRILARQAELRPSQFRVWDATTEPPPAARPAAVVILGSPESVNSDAEWIRQLSSYVRKLHGVVPILGICFGHELLAVCLGGRVVPHPDGWRIGAYPLHLTEAAFTDPVFSSLAEVPPERAPWVFEVHRETVSALPEDCTVLGRDDAAFPTAVRFGTSSWGVIFHPELRREIVERYAAARLSGQQLSQSLASLRQPGVAAITRTGRQLLQRFLSFAGIFEARGKV